MIENPLFLQELTYSARQLRHMLEVIFTEGVIDPGGGAFLTTQRAAGANLSVDVAPGTAIVEGDDQAEQGVYLVRSTTTENLAIAPGDAANPRIDVVVLEIRDDNVTAAGFNDARLRIVQGLPAGAPVAPATPPSCIALSWVWVAAAPTPNIVNANIADVRATSAVASFTTTSNFESVTTAERDAAGFAANNYAGRTIYNETTLRLEWWTGAVWAAVVSIVDVQVFTASGTWTKPGGAKTVEVIAFGAGGGGGRNNDIAQAGGGGGGGARARGIFPAAALGATETVTVGAGGAGASVAGSSGGAGGNSSFGAHLTAYGGGGGGYTVGSQGVGGGGGGTGGAGTTGVATAVAGGAPRQDTTTVVHGVGGQGGGSSKNAEHGGGGGGSTAAPGGGSIYGGPGGGGGGQAGLNAGAAGGGNDFATGGGGAGGAAQGAGVAGTSRSGSGRAGTGGGGGGGSNIAAPPSGAGAAGGVPAAGGGGGGGNSGGAGQTGNGGAGGRGEVIVVTYF